MNFTTDKAWETHKKKHPGADKSQHTFENNKPAKGKGHTPHSLRNTGDSAAKAGRHDKAFEQYSAAAELFRRQKSPEAAASMDAAAKEQAKLWKKQQDKSKK